MKLASQAKTKNGKETYHVFSKLTQTWSAKPMRIFKDRAIFRKMVKRALEVVVNDTQLPIPQVPNLPSTISFCEKPQKTHVISK